MLKCERLAIVAAGLLALTLVGCGSNSDSGLADQTLAVDLVAEKVLTPGAVVASQNWEIQVTVSNGGGIDARAFDIYSEVRRGGGLVSAGRTSVETGLSASDTGVYTIQMSPLSYGSSNALTGTVFVDSDLNIQESNENNNLLSYVITVLPINSNGGADGVLPEKVNN